MKELEPVVEPLLTWYHFAKRDLPWRHDKDPYHIWVSEIMLQQTRVEAVKEYYLRFMNELKTIQDLAQVEEEKLLKLWQGLGYYSRARNLKKAAEKIMSDYDGVFPTTYEEVISLPGIGSYTAGAILSIAFQKKVTAIDGNVLRVISRMLGSFDPIDKESTKEKIKVQLERILPDEVGDFNQALMELGALVCLPNGEPKCESCPLSILCQANIHHLTSQIPIKETKKKRRIEEKTVFLFVIDDKIAIQKRTVGLLKGLYEFPNIEGKKNQKEVLQYLKEQGIDAIHVKEEKETKHIFTHVEWDMIGYTVILEEEIPSYQWVTLEEMETKYPIPTAFQTYYDLLKEKR